jgi:hypothetical protein
MTIICFLLIPDYQLSIYGYRILIFESPLLTIHLYEDCALICTLLLHRMGLGEITK